MIDPTLLTKMPVSLKLLSFLCILQAFECDCTILTKPGYNRSSVFFYVEADDFESFLLLSTAVIDKTLLLKKLLESDFRVSLISYPRGWGKTINLGMMKMFVGLEANEYGVLRPTNETRSHRIFMNGEIVQGNYQLNSVLDKPFLISQHVNFCKKYMGKYPVISLNFDRVDGEYDLIINDVKGLIADLYRSYEYMITVYETVIDSPKSSTEQRKDAQKKLDGFLQYYKGTKNVDLLINSLKYLSDLLYDHFKKPSYVLIDNYEKPLKYMMEDFNIPFKDFDKYMNFFTKFISRTFEPSNHVKAGYITCELKLLAEVFYTPLKKFVDYDYMENELHDFFGLTYKEAEEVYEHWFAPQSLRYKGHDYYNGYGISTDQRKRLCSILGVVTYAYRHFQMDTYSVDNENTYDTFEYFFKIPEFKKITKLLIKRVDVEIPRAALGNLTITMEEYIAMKEYLASNDDDDNVEQKPIISIAFKFLYSHGYLTLQEKSSRNVRYVVNATDMVLPPEASNETVVLRVASKEVCRDLDDQITYPPSGVVYQPGMSMDSDSLGL